MMSITARTSQLVSTDIIFGRLPIADSLVRGKMFKTLDEAKSYAGTLVKRKWGGGRRKKKK